MPHPTSAQIAAYLGQNIRIDSETGCYLWVGDLHQWSDASGVEHVRPIVQLPYHKGNAARRIAYQHMNREVDLTGMQVVQSPDMTCSELCINPEHAIAEETVVGRAKRELLELDDELTENNPFAVAVIEKPKQRKEKKQKSGFRDQVSEWVKTGNQEEFDKHIFVGGKVLAQRQYLPDTWPQPLSIQNAECTKCGTQSELNSDRWIQHIGCEGFFAPPTEK